MAEGKGDRAVRAQKRPRLSDGEPWRKLELFPTPPWATRALFERVFPALPERVEAFRSAADPAAGLGHMSHVLAEYFEHVAASDVYIYPLADGGDAELLGIERRDFLDPAQACPEVDWIITNPPFEPAARFLDAALQQARVGVALLLRIQWLEGCNRYAEVYATRPPSLVAPFVERAPMCEGGWDPDGDTATMYAWFVWRKNAHGLLPGPLGPRGAIPAYLIPPGQREALSRPADRLLAARCVPGFIPPSRLKKAGKDQASLRFDGDAA